MQSVLFKGEGADYNKLMREGKISSVFNADTQFKDIMVKIKHSLHEPHSERTPAALPPVR